MRINKLIIVCLLCLICLLLSSCSTTGDNNTLDTKADFSIDIALPYATATPPPENQRVEQALVIDSSGGVIVNDTEQILQNNKGGVVVDGSLYKSLRMGNTGLAVQALQLRLKELNYFDKDVTGLFDTDTDAAVRRFEQTYGTMQTGVATAELQTKLFSADALVYGSEEYNRAVVSQYKVLQRGDVGSAVYALQQRLRTLGYPLTELSGIYDNETANAIMLFYEAYGLKADDVANVALQKEIYSDSARTYGGLAQQEDEEEALSEQNVLFIQERLAALGYLSNEVNNYDTRIRLAIKLFEEINQQEPTGHMDKDLLELLESADAKGFDAYSILYPSLVAGASGEAVSALQQRLVDLGFARGYPNGTYEDATISSLKIFQRANELEETGVASSFVQSMLFSSFARNVNGELGAIVQGE